MASKRRNMFHKNKTQETTEKECKYHAGLQGLQVAWSTRVDSGLEVTGAQIFVESIDSCPSDKNLFDVSSLKVTRVSKDELGFKGTMSVRADVEKDTLVNLDLFMLINKRWRLLMRVINNLDFCVFIREDKIIYGNILPYSDLPHSCPFKKITDSNDMNYDPNNSAEDGRNPPGPTNSQHKMREQ
ncbi:hypothetical protein AAG570_012378 [Ranatra chinensis]|uniref:Uncharacterized protein n=1 Tax=Ranatra chinensis TaxID=642074 RepID=A0ABD0YIM0_9HEMI